MFDGRERMRHLRQEALVARVDDHADEELVNRGRREGFPGGRTLVQNSISRTKSARFFRPADAVQVAAVIRYEKGRMVQTMITRWVILVSLAVCGTVSVSAGGGAGGGKGLL